jgi:hypothetical protein
LRADGAESDAICEVSRENHQFENDIPGLLLELVGIGAKRWQSVLLDDGANLSDGVRENLQACELDNFNELKLFLTKETVKQSHYPPLSIEPFLASPIQHIAPNMRPGTERTENGNVRERVPSINPTGNIHRR